MNKKVAIDSGKCMGMNDCMEKCETPTCFEVCPSSAIAPDSGFKATLLYPENCSGCGECVKACINKAVQFVR